MAPVLKRQITLTPEMFSLPVNTIVGKSYGSSCWLYWRGEENIESRMFENEKDMEYFVKENKFTTAL